MEKQQQTRVKQTNSHTIITSKHSYIETHNTRRTPQTPCTDFFFFFLDEKASAHEIGILEWKEQNEQNWRGNRKKKSAGIHNYTAGSKAAPNKSFIRLLIHISSAKAISVSFWLLKRVVKQIREETESCNRSKLQTRNLFHSQQHSARSVMWVKCVSGVFFLVSICIHTLKIYAYGVQIA